MQLRGHPGRHVQPDPECSPPTSPAATTTTYGWDKLPNRTSVTTGGGAAVTTTYDAANRPKDQAGVANAYTSDADGRLTTQPSATGAGFQRYEWDSLGRLTTVKPPSGGSTIATYTYDPLDRLRLADYGANTRTRFRYVGLTTAVAQLIDDKTGAVSRNIGTGWGGERQLDWTGTNSNIRYYGTNAHHDTVWTASSTGAVSATLRYDPWGTLTTSSGSSLPDFRFQGSWFDDTTKLSWVITRWYAPAPGRFLSEDSLLGTPADPPSRHLYAYAAGEPVRRWDPDGRFWYVVRQGDTLWSLAKRFYGNGALLTRISRGNPGGGITPHNLNHSRASIAGLVGKCIWVPFARVAPPATCTRRDAWNISGTDLWRPFDWIVSFMTSRMIDDRDYLNRKYSDFFSRSINLKADFASRVCGECAWDYKHTTLNPRYGGGRQFWTSVRDDPAPEVLRSDVWGNIFYAYVGRATGISEFELFGVQKTPLGGVNDAVDDEAVRLGFRLWNSYGMGITADRLRSTVLNNMARFRAAGADGVRYPLVAVLKS